LASRDAVARPVKKFQYLNTARTARLATTPTRHQTESGRYSRLMSDSHTKIRTQAAPTHPASSVTEKYTKKATPEATQIQGRTRGPAIRNSTAVGIRNRKYGTVVKITQKL